LLTDYVIEWTERSEGGQRLGARQPGWRTVPEGVRLVRARVQLRPPASLAATTAAFFLVYPASRA
jgi:hypothetical protein